MRTMLTILTPVYNRRDKIIKLYNSLVNQTCKEFQWLIVDDGSTDNVEELIESIKRSEYSFVIDFVKKTNGGKHTAINYSHPFILGNMVAIVDSDDELIPNSVETILEKWSAFEHDESIGGIIFIKGRINDAIDTKLFIFDGVVGTPPKVMLDKNRQGGGFEIIRVSLLKRYPFPEIEGEKYIGESYLWNSIFRTYNMVCYNKVLYRFEFYEDGLTKHGRLLRLKSPKGCMELENVILRRKPSFSVKFKNCILYTAYGLIAKYHVGKICRLCYSKVIYISIFPGFVLYLYWKYKYKV